MKVHNIKDGQRIAVQHGELWLQPIDKLPRGKKSTHKMFILGHSESGHHHVLESKVDFTLVEGKNRTILLDEVATLFHKKSFDIHETRVLAPGAYEVYQKTEYNPFTKVIQRLWD